MLLEALVFPTNVANNFELNVETLTFRLSLYFHKKI